MSKLGFRFAAVPKDRHPEWFEVSLLARTLGLELFFTIYDEKTRTSEVATAGSWSVSLCKLLRIETDDRRAACRAFEALERHGLIVISDGKVRLVFRADEDLGPRRPDPRKRQTTSDDVNGGSIDRQPGVNLSVTPSNDSTQCSQTDKKEEKRSDIPPRVREEQGSCQIGHDLILGVTGLAYAGAEWLQQLERIGAKSDAERRAVFAAMSCDPWCKENKYAVTPTYVLKHWARFAAGNPPLKNVVRAAAGSGGRRFSGPSRVPTAEEYAQDAKEKAPWEM